MWTKTKFISFWPYDKTQEDFSHENRQFPLKKWGVAHVGRVRKKTKGSWPKAYRLFHLWKAETCSRVKLGNVWASSFLKKRKELRLTPGEHSSKLGGTK